MTIAGYTRVDALTQEQWDYGNQCFAEFVSDLPDRLVNTLLELRGRKMGSQVDRFEHSLQTATRALRDGADAEMIVCALLHDIGDDFAPCNHGEVAAAILRPYVSPENAWMIEHHEVFLGYHFYQFLGRDRHERNKFKDHPAFEQAIIFCDRWDQLSFDPEYDSLPLSEFRPMLDAVFSRQPKVVSG